MKLKLVLGLIAFISLLSANAEMNKVEYKSSYDECCLCNLQPDTTKVCIADSIKGVKEIVVVANK